MLDVPAAMSFTASAIVLALLAAGLRRVPSRHAPVFVLGSRCRQLPVLVGWTWAPAGLGRLALVDLTRRRVSYGPAWHELPTGERVRLEVAVGLTVADPCPLAVAGLNHAADATGTLRVRVIRSFDWVDDRLRSTIPALLPDLIPGMGLAVGPSTDPSRWWPLLRGRLLNTFDHHGLIVQEVWVREFGVEARSVTAPGKWVSQGLDTPA